MRVHCGSGHWCQVYSVPVIRARVGSDRGRAQGRPGRARPNMSHKRRWTGDIFRISNVQNISNAERGFFHAIHPKTTRTVRGPKAKVRCVKRVESRRVHPGRRSQNLMQRGQAHCQSLMSWTLSRSSSSMKLHTEVRAAQAGLLLLIGSCWANGSWQKCSTRPTEYEFDREHFH